jgi:hypothetical protein
MEPLRGSLSGFLSFASIKMEATHGILICGGDHPTLGSVIPFRTRPKHLGSLGDSWQPIRMGVGEPGESSDERTPPEA